MPQVLSLKFVMACPIPSTSPEKAVPLRRPLDWRMLIHVALQPVWLKSPRAFPEDIWNETWVWKGQKTIAFEVEGRLKMKNNRYKDNRVGRVPDKPSPFAKPHPTWLCIRR